MSSNQIIELPPNTPGLDGPYLAVRPHTIPAWRTAQAIKNGVERNLLFHTWGGLGDQICSEPTLRYAFNAFKGCRISLASDNPELFTHLPFKKVFQVKEEKPRWDKYLVFDTIFPPSNLAWQFFSHCITNCVDFPALSALRCQLPCKDREINLKPPAPSNEDMIKLMDPDRNDVVLVHAGRHWPTKTFPKPWWDAILKGLVDSNLQPVLIGANTDDNRGTVDVDPTGCVDLRNKTSTLDCVWLAQRARVLLTNDSSPLHMAASRNPDDPETGLTWIGYLATCKHYDYITHYRQGVFQWREENLSLGGIWDITDHCPNKKDELTVDEVDIEILKTWLPKPESVVEWTKQKISLRSK